MEIDLKEVLVRHFSGRLPQRSFSACRADLGRRFVVEDRPETSRDFMELFLLPLGSLIAGARCSKCAVSRRSGMERGYSRKDRCWPLTNDSLQEGECLDYAIGI